MFCFVSVTGILDLITGKENQSFAFHAHTPNRMGTKELTEGKGVSSRAGGTLPLAFRNLICGVGRHWRRKCWDEGKAGTDSEYLCPQTQLCSRCP